MLNFLNRQSPKAKIDGKRPFPIIQIFIRKSPTTYRITSRWLNNKSISKRLISMSTRFSKILYKYDNYYLIHDFKTNEQKITNDLREYSKDIYSKSDKDNKKNEDNPYKIFYSIKIFKFNIIISTVGIYAIHRNFDPGSTFLRDEIPGIKFRLGFNTFLHFLFSIILSIFTKDYIKEIFLSLEDFTIKNYDLILKKRLNLSKSIEIDLKPILSFFQLKNAYRLYGLVKDNRIHISKNYDYSKCLTYKEIKIVNEIEKKYGEKAKENFENKISLLNYIPILDFFNITSILNQPDIFELTRSANMNFVSKEFKFKKKKITHSNNIFKKVKKINKNNTYTFDTKIFCDTEVVKEQVVVNTPQTIYIEDARFKTFDRLSIVQTDEYILKESFSEDPNIFYYAENFPWLKKINNNEVSILEKMKIITLSDGIFCSVGLSSNYFTWLIEILPRIYASSNLSKKNKIYILGKKKKWHDEYLKLCNLNKEVKFLDPELSYEFVNTDIIITSIREISNDNAIKYLRNHLLKNKFQQNNDFQKVYVSRRRYLSHRYLINEIEVEKYLLAKGFKIIIPEKLTVHQQISIFKNAKVIIGPTGAWASNLIFCKQKPDVFIITPMDHLGIFFCYLSNISGCNFQWLGSLPLNQFKNDRIHNDHYLDLKILERLKI